MKHSHLSASAAHRWLECPGSVGMSMDVERTDSAASSEGTRAHEIVEQLLRGVKMIPADETMFNYCMDFDLHIYLNTILAHIGTISVHILNILEVFPLITSLTDFHALVISCTPSCINIIPLIRIVSVLIL